MESVATELKNPGRYATAALNGKVRDWQRTGPAKLEPMGIGRDLERIGGANERVQVALDRKVFFEQVKATLNDRDQVILLLLLDGSSDTEVASALAVTPATGRKAIQRVKERIAATLKISRVKNDPEHGARTLCPTKG
jgi:DNA-directed RNA polymerase specialized sigma24 family protein